ncbi:MAG TPA: glycosyltransferase, partial [Mycobacterium sp.]|nr:glycosyltransferase [Mycobacterium sp.]
MQVLVVIPTYNEAENIETVLRKVRSAMPDATVLVVDDSSPDGTAAIAERLGA